LGDKGNLPASPNKFDVLVCVMHRHGGIGMPEDPCSPNDGRVAQYEKSQIVLKLRGARMRKRVREGRREGRKPFGNYHGEDALLARLRALRADGSGFDRIAARMNAEGLPTRTGKPWHGVVVNRILTAASA
jgi:hypothetical protein